MPDKSWDVDGPRVEATAEQWKELYEIADRVRDMEPWKELSPINLIIVKDDGEKELYCSVLGHSSAEHLKGVITYEGADELNTCMMQALHVEAGLPPEYALHQLKGLAGYFMLSEVVGEDVEAVVRQIGTETEEDLWPYFLSYRPGFFPAMPDAAEVEELTRRYALLEHALVALQESGTKLEEDEVFACERSDAGEWSCKAAPFPERGFRLLTVRLGNDEYTRRLTTLPHTDDILQLDAVITDVPTADPMYNRALNPAIILIMDARTGLIVSCETVPGPIHPGESAVNRLIEYIMEHGIPEKVQVSNTELFACLEDLCTRCGIRLEKVPVMPDMVGAASSLRMALQNQPTQAVYMGVHEGLLS